MKPATLLLAFIVMALLGIVGWLGIQQLAYQDTGGYLRLIGFSAGVLTLFLTFVFSGKDGEGVQNVTQPTVSGFEAQPYADSSTQQVAENKGARWESFKPSDCYEYFARRYGISYESINISCEIKEDGSAELIRTVDITAYQKIGKLNCFLFASDAKTRAHNPTIEVTDTGVDVSSNIAVNIETIDEGSYQINFVPELSNGDTVSYELHEETSGGIYVQDKEGDYFGWYIDRPTKNLSLSVYLPHGVTVRKLSTEAIYPNVKEVNGAQYHFAEQERLSVKSINEVSRVKLELDIDYPIVGITYFIRWYLDQSESTSDSADTVATENQS